MNPAESHYSAGISLEDLLKKAGLYDGWMELLKEQQKDT